MPCVYSFQVTDWSRPTLNQVARKLIRREYVSVKTLWIQYTMSNPNVLKVQATRGPNNNRYTSAIIQSPLSYLIE